LKFEEAIALHAIAVELDGGARDLIDRGKLESALAAPSATFDGQLLNATIVEQAAAYWFGICQAHAFLDGNKRVAFLCAFAFLKLNGFELNATPDEAAEMTLRIARGESSKREVAGFLETRTARLW
jgi:death-on-curing protein